MTTFQFYSDSYGGNSISETDFPRICRNATAKLNQYKRSFTITGDEESENMAVCAIADAMYYYEIAANGGICQSVSIGNVSTSTPSSTVPDTTPAAQEAEFYRCAKLYLSIYRGCS